MAPGHRGDEQEVERLLVADHDPVELAARLLAQVEQRVVRASRRFGPLERRNRGAARRPRLPPPSLAGLQAGPGGTAEGCR